MRETGPSKPHGTAADSGVVAPEPWLTTEELESVDSTNGHSLRDLTPWRVVTAREQVAGRGRRGRGWVSPAGTSVSMSLTVPLPEHAAPGWLPLLTGLSVARALGVLAPGARFALKWPNDVLAAPATEAVDLRKVCGILCQVSSGGLVVVGVGVNVLVPPEALPTEAATSLQLLDPAAPVLGAPDPVAAVASAVRDSFLVDYDRWRQGGDEFAALQADYRAACATVGAFVDLHLPDGDVVRGLVRGIDPTGELLVVPEGAAAPRRYAAGDVVHARPADASGWHGSPTVP